MEEFIMQLEDNIERNSWTQELINEFKEEILGKQLYSFVNDW